MTRILRWLIPGGFVLGLSLALALGLGVLQVVFARGVVGVTGFFLVGGLLAFSVGLLVLSQDLSVF